MQIRICQRECDRALLAQLSLIVEFLTCLAVGWRITVEHRIGQGLRQQFAALYERLGTPEGDQVRASIRDLAANGLCGVTA